MEMTSIRQPHRFYGFDERTYLDALSSVKYYAFQADSLEEKGVPYGYKEIGRVKRQNSDITDVIYENQYALPLGYTYDKKISEDYYNTLNSVEKQQAMLQAVVVDKPEQDSSSEVNYVEQKLDYTVDNSNGVTWNKETGDFKVDHAEACITLTFDATKNCDTYVRLVGLNINNSEEIHFTANTSSNYSQAKLYLSNSQYRWDLKRENYLINLGHNNDGNTTCTISFAQMGNFKLKDMEVYSLPMTGFAQQISKLKEESLTALKQSNNKIVGDITVSQDKVLCFSILYNTGWKLKVDGKQSPLYKANTMYMATDISKGSHSIELTYETPGMDLGKIISCLALVILIGGFVLSHVWKGKENNNKTIIK
jgi:uncharacterized membrane protein YfhO